MIDPNVTSLVPQLGGSDSASTPAAGTTTKEQDRQLEEMGKLRVWRTFQVPAVMLSLLHACDKIHDDNYPLTDEATREKAKEAWEKQIQSMPTALDQDAPVWDPDTSAGHFWFVWYTAISELAYVNKDEVREILKKQYQIWLSGKRPADPSPALLAFYQPKKPTTPAELGQIEEKGAFTPLTIGLIIGGVAVAGLVTWLVLRRRKAAAGG